MSSSSRQHFYPLICLLGLASCGGGGGGGNNPPAPPPADTTPPDTTFNSTPPARGNQRRGNISVTSNETGVVFELSVNGGAYGQGHAANTFFLEVLLDGEYSVNVRARDAAGNADPTPANFLWTVDTQAPDTTVTTTTGARSNSAAATFTLTATEAGTFEASVDGGAYATVVSPWSLTGLTDGAHTISVRAIDAVTNADPTPATFAWQIDSTMPTARVIFPTPVSYTDATQLHVRGTAQDANGITSIRINGVAAVTSDAYAHWSAVVPLSIGDNALVVSAVDGFGNSNAAAASVAVANRGAVANSLHALAFDAASGRVFMTDPERRALLAVRVSDRYTSIISDANRGTGTVMQQPYGLALDGTRAFISDVSLDTLVGIDIATGNRTQLAAPAAQDPMRLGIGLAYHAPSQRVFAGTLEGAILAIDLANGGTRTVFAGGGGATGPAFDGIRGLTLDSSSGTTRLLVAEGGGHAIVAVDLATGVRTTISYAAPLDPNNQVGSGPAVYGLGQIVVDSARQRILVPDVSPTPFVGRLFSIDIATGNRTVLTASTSEVELHFPNAVAFDPAAEQVYVGMAERARVYRYDVASTQVTPFAESNVGTGYVLNYPSGILLDSSSGTTGLYSATTYPAPTIYRTGIADGMRFSLANYLGTGGAPTFGSPGNFVHDTRAGMAGKALFLDTPLNNPVITLNNLDLVSGALTLVASAPFPDYRFMSRMALDAVNNRVIVGLTFPAGGAGSVVAMDNVTGALTTLASLSVGNGPPMYEIGAVALVPSTFGTTARLLVAADYNLLAVDGSGNRSFISAGGNIGSGPPLFKVDDMVVDFPGNRALVVGASAQAMQWVDLTTGNRTMASGVNPDDLSSRGSGPPLFGQPKSLETDLAANIAYVTVMQTAILAVDLESGDRVILSR